MSTLRLLLVGTVLMAVVLALTEAIQYLDDQGSLGTVMVSRTL